MSRVYQSVPMGVGDLISLDESASHHLTHVLHVKPHDPIVLFNGRGGEYEASIQRIDKRTVFAEVKRFCAIERESPLRAHLAQGISRGEKMDFTIQKAVELGVSEITPLFTERCGVQLSKDRWEKRLDHWQKIIIRAAEQCGRNTLPVLHDILTLSSWLETTLEGVKFALLPEGTKTWQAFSGINHAVILAGPEGGFSPLEVERIQANGFFSVRLGPRILRTETAALAALAGIQSRFGDMGTSEEKRKQG